MKEPYLTPDELRDRYKGRVSLRTLANWRASGEGPAFTKIGGKVLYALDWVLKWEAKRTRLLPALMTLLLSFMCDICACHLD